MCIPLRERSRKDRVLFGIANIALCIGIVLPYLVKAASETERNWVHGVTGMLLGISIGINLFGLRFARRCSQKQI